MTENTEDAEATENIGLSEENKTESKSGFRLGNAEYIVIAIGIILLVVFFYNTYKITNIATGATGITGSVIGNSVLPRVSASEIMPSGIPKIYGKELGVNFDEVSESNPQRANANIAILSNLDRTITLTGNNMQRYIDITSQISCEFCCGAASIIRSDGSSACGCAHSFAMRGLAKYLITQHGKEYSDDEILEELGKWKVLFFPGKHEAKASVLKSQGIEINYINLASNAYRGIEKGTGSGGGMVGGC